MDLVFESKCKLKIEVIRFNRSNGIELTTSFRLFVRSYRLHYYAKLCLNQYNLFGSRQGGFLDRALWAGTWAVATFGKMLIFRFPTNEQKIFAFSDFSFRYSSLSWIHIALWCWSRTDFQKSFCQCSFSCRLNLIFLIICFILSQIKKIHVWIIIFEMCSKVIEGFLRSFSFSYSG